MPVETRIRPEFGALVCKIKGDDSFGQAAIRTSISQAYLLQMCRGKVPSPAIIEKFARGYADRGADLQALLVAAGYEQPPYNLREVTVEDVTFAVPADVEYTEDRLREIAELVKGDQPELKEKYDWEERKSA